MLTQTKGIAEKRVAARVTKVTCHFFETAPVPFSAHAGKSGNEYRSSGKLPK
jgi:hypothetical protein